MAQVKSRLVNEGKALNFDPIDENFNPKDLMNNSI